MGKLADLCIVPAPPQIDDVGYPEGAQFLGVLPGPYRATERQPPAYEKDLQPYRLPPSVRTGLGV
jgi:hypothetical protein